MSMCCVSVMSTGLSRCKQNLFKPVFRVQESRNLGMKGHTAQISL